MESRKIQKVGAATLTISLPKDWAEQRNLKKGDQVFLVEEGEALKVLPGLAIEDRRREASEYIIDADLCDEPGMLERVVVGNYVLGREKIIVRSALRLRSDHQDEARRATRRLMGIGIVEEGPSKVVLQCSINPTNYPLETLIKRLYNLGSTMLSEALEALVTRDVALAEDALKREDDADMMYWLILRLVLSAQLDEALVEELGMRSRIEIPGYRVIARDLETVADHCRLIAENVRILLGLKARIPNSVIKALQSLAQTITEIYAMALGGLLSRDLGQANKAIHLAEGMTKRKEEFVRLVLKDMRAAKGMDPTLILPLQEIFSSLTQIAEYGKAIATIAYNRYLEKPSNLCRPATPSA
ncbi:MAG TPA: phosphate uptake regulator PhoU [Thermoplasmata archaeon]|nr:phosphate uptake regulator PhoU [Thermoplasmata archaeon]